MAKKNNIYKCKVCGYEMVGFMGKCPECSSFGSFEEVTKNEITGKKKIHRGYTKAKRGSIN